MDRIFSEESSPCGCLWGKARAGVFLATFALPVKRKGFYRLNPNGKRSGEKPLPEPAAPEGPSKRVDAGACRPPALTARAGGWGAAARRPQGAPGPAGEVGLRGREAASPELAPSVGRRPRILGSEGRGR